MKRASGIVLSAIIVILAGCDQPQPQNPPTTKVPYQRFLPIQPPRYFTEGIPWNGFFALDTKTGTLCFTMGNRVFKGSAEWANDVPNCAQVLADHPDN
jgi:hypothetical protein